MNTGYGTGVMRPIFARFLVKARYYRAMRRKLSHKMHAVNRDQ